jgi:hypothetical protein
MRFLPPNTPAYVVELARERHRFPRLRLWLYYAQFLCEWYWHRVAHRGEDFNG